MRAGAEKFLNMNIPKLIALLVVCFSASSAASQDLNVGTIVDCKSTEALRVWSSDERFSKQRTQTFMVRIGEQELEFISNSGAYNSGVVLRKYYHQPYFVTGYTDTTGFSLDRQKEKRRFRFHYSSTLSANIFTMFGYCRKLQ